MAREKKLIQPETSHDLNDFSEDLIKSLNQEVRMRIAYNLRPDESPTHVKRWLSTGSKLVDYAIANKKNGGVPEGRIVEISGMPATGKSHIAFAISRTVQQLGGLVVYIDTENATPVEKLDRMGIDVNRRFVYCDTHCTEEVFKILESTIINAKKVVAKDVPILVVWDSVAATSPKAELDGEYDQDTIGLQARVISKGLRKATGVIGQNNVTFLVLNQLRSKVGGMIFGDPFVTPGGMAIPFHASVRVRLTSGSPIKDNETGAVFGISVNATIIKNKVAPPHRKVNFDILFGEGINENDSLLEEIKQATKKSPLQIDDRVYSITDAGAWKQFNIIDAKTGEAIETKKFQKSGFGDLLLDDTYGPTLEKIIDQILTVSVERNKEGDDG